MDISSVGSTAYTQGQVQNVRPGDRAGDDKTADNAAANSTPAPAKADDGDGDDRGATSDPVSRSSPAVQEALLNLQTSQ
jgi:hypothetical protein